MLGRAAKGPCGRGPCKLASKRHTGEALDKRPNSVMAEALDKLGFIKICLANLNLFNPIGFIKICLAKLILFKPIFSL
jgi:hypothetical protein